MNVANLYFSQERELQSYNANCRQRFLNSFLDYLSVSHIVHIYSHTHIHTYILYLSIFTVYSDLSANMITALPPGVFSWTYLRYLLVILLHSIPFLKVIIRYLGQNSIASLPANLFSGMTKLYYMFDLLIVAMIITITLLSVTCHSIQLLFCRLVS